MNPRPPCQRVHAVASWLHVDNRTEKIEVTPYVDLCHHFRASPDLYRLSEACKRVLPCRYPVAARRVDALAQHVRCLNSCINAASASVYSNEKDGRYAVSRRVGLGQRSPNAWGQTISPKPVGVKGYHGLGSKFRANVGRTPTLSDSFRVVAPFRVESQSRKGKIVRQDAVQKAVPNGF